MGGQAFLPSPSTYCYVWKSDLIYRFFQTSYNEFPEEVSLTLPQLLLLPSFPACHASTNLAFAHG